MAGAATPVVAVMAWGLTTRATANSTTGMIAGDYSAQLPAFYLRNSTGYTRVCIQVRGSGNEAVGIIMALKHDGTWEQFDYGTGLTLKRDCLDCSICTLGKQS